ncbi:hypothetical protein CVT24_010104 [Panaeolus cyanescens]|uniref:NAD-dependent epimerase/dehydratase domain-containing protein n=1 Tax=Panaeolus cyanescens TaxID=181874 RepID=A0A409W9F6_9AGAR|nr:hypothetical protein CVT24_010104 [Panaeolus cyanescens]
MSQPQLVLVTGITGFIAGHIFDQLLEAGYRVRGTARASKLPRLTALNIPNAEFVHVEDLAKDDMTGILQDVDVVIHTAAPLPGHQSPEDTLKTAHDGTLNIVKQAHQAGITKIIVTETFGNAMDPSLVPGFAGITIKDSDWGTVTKEDFLKNVANPFYTYFAAKNLAEQALWAYVDNVNKSEGGGGGLDVTTLLPGFVFGPYSKLLPKPTSAKELGTNLYPYMVMTGRVPPGPAPPFVVDVRDVARAHVRAISLPPASSSTTRKRFLLNGGNYTWLQTAQDLATRTDLLHSRKVQIADFDEFPKMPGVVSVLDTQGAREVLGMEFVEPRRTMRDVVDELVGLVEVWEGRERREVN